MHAGDLLALIDPRPYQAQLDQALANQDRDEAQLANARQSVRTKPAAAATRLGPPQTVETGQGPGRAVTAMVQSDAAQVENARVNLGYTRMTSPINGVTGIRLVDIGNIVQPSDPNGVVVLTQLQPISVIFTLPETNCRRSRRRWPKGPLTVLAYSQDNKTELDKGTLGVFDNQIVQTSGSAGSRPISPTRPTASGPANWSMLGC